MDLLSKDSVIEVQISDSEVFSVPDAERRWRRSVPEVSITLCNALVAFWQYFASITALVHKASEFLKRLTVPDFNNGPFFDVLEFDELLVHTQPAEGAW